jgi:membrane-associated phospholipid phosphatase
MHREWPTCRWSDAAHSAVTAVDHWTSCAMSAVAGRSSWLDWLLLRAFQTDLLKLFPMIVLLAWPGERGRRELGVAGLLSASLALAGAATAQRFGSDRVRPALSGLFHFPALPTEIQTDLVSFPSETAAVAFALAAVLMKQGPLRAWFAFFWSVVVVCMPRLYGGYHYASDLVAGAVIGSLSCYLVLASGTARWLAAAMDRARPKTQAAARIVLMAYGFELAQLFAGVRVIAEG